MFNKRKRYIAIFLIKEQESYNIVGKKFFNPTNNSVEFKGKVFIIKVSIPTYTKGLKLLYFVDIISSKQLLFVKPTKANQVDTELIDMILSKKIIKQLTSELGNTDFKTIILYLIIGLTIGGLIGFIIGKGGL